MRCVLVRLHWPIRLPILVGAIVVASRLMGQAPDQPTAAPAEKDPKAASAGHAGLTPVELASRLEAAKQQDERLDIELRSGRSYIRCRLLRLDRAGPSGPPSVLRVESDEFSKPIAIEFNSIRTLRIERELAYELQVGKVPARDTTAEKEAEARAQWMARARDHGVTPWPELSDKEHEAAVEENGKQIERIHSMFHGMLVYETAEFTFCSDIPSDQVGPYVSSLDHLYDAMSAMYGIKKGTPVWRGKCLIVAFVEKSEFVEYERSVFRKAGENYSGYAHYLPDGRVVVSCCRGDDPNFFAQLLTHETSHGFNYRYRTPQPLPSWVNEGMADWIGNKLVPACTVVRSRQQASLRTMRETRSMQGMLDADRIDIHSYGIASSLTAFLVRKDQKKYVSFINGIKEGKSWQESLKDSYHVASEQLASEYGRSIGIPDLKP
jgi:hypothetical protein